MPRRAVPPSGGPPSQGTRPAAAQGVLDPLLLRVGRGDRDAFRTVYDRLAAPLYRLARARGLPDPVAETLVERVLLRLWRDAPAFGRGSGSGMAWTLARVDDVLRDLAGPRADGDAPIGR